MRNEIALIVLSCDKYSDLWPIFISQFEKNWPDFPHDKFISTNFLSANSSSFHDLKVGKDNSWSDGVIKTLNKIKNKYDYALITLEDLVLTEKVDNDEFQAIVCKFVHSGGNYLKFIRKPKPTIKFNEYFGEIKPGSLYRPTCVYSLWKIETLLKLLNKNENAWEFERFGAVRSDNYDGFYVVYEDFFKVSNTIVKGKWVPKEKKKIEKMGYMVDNLRLELSIIEALKLQIHTCIFYLFTNIVPWKYRRTMVFNLKNGKMENLIFNIKVKLRILRNKLIEKRQYRKWLRNEKPVPPPHLVKQNLIKQLKDKNKTGILIETGTYLGDMVFAQRNNFEDIYSIEIQPLLFMAAQRRFKKFKNIKILLGDSGIILHEIIPKIPKAAIIWLDGHYSGGITGKSELNCPIFNELNAIFKNNKNHLILIDDANCFNGTNDYPTYEALSEFIEEFNYNTRIEDNVIIAEKNI